MIPKLRRRAFALVAGLMLALPVVALAADSHGEEAHAAEEHAAPSLFSVDPGLMIWTVVTFLVVLVVLRFTAWKPLMEGLERREKSIAGAIEEASNIKSEAENLLAKYESMLDHAKDEARSILDEARQDGVKVQEEIRERARKEAEEFKERARREIELAKDGALEEVWGTAAMLSTELASRILGRTLDGSDQERLVKQLLADMRSELKERKAESV